MSKRVHIKVLVPPTRTQLTWATFTNQTMDAYPYRFTPADRDRLVYHWETQDADLLYQSLVRYIASFGLRETEGVSLYTLEGVCEVLATALAKPQKTLYTAALEATVLTPPGRWLLCVPELFETA